MKLLIWYRIVEGDFSDIFRQIDYNTLYSDVSKNVNGVLNNTGNKVWFQGIVTEMMNTGNEVEFMHEGVTWDEINATYDAVIVSMANMFSKTYIEALKSCTKSLKKSKIPIYVISVGAQISGNKECEELVHEIGYQVSEFVDVVYKSGGAIGLRGYVTKEFIDKCCHNEAEVIGCPSMYQMGRNLRIDNNKVSFEEFNYVINGEIIWKNIKNIDKCMFIDQNIEQLYNNNYWEIKDKKLLRQQILSFSKAHGALMTRLLINDKIKLFFDIPEWKDFLINSDINYSIGTRIHGNVMGILAGIPVSVCCRDDRVKEIAEYYSMHTISTSEIRNKSIYDIYLEADYSKFNKEFSSKYDQFEAFLRSCNLIKSHLKTSYSLWQKPKPIELKNRDVIIRRLNEACPRNVELLLADLICKISSKYTWI